jgi:Protein of unknown function (DUF2516)
VVIDNPSAVSIIGWFFELIALGALIFEGFAFVDALRRPRAAFVAAGKQTKPLWLVITGVALVIGLASIFAGLLAVLFLAVIGFVAAAIYIVDVRPKIKDYRGSGGSGSHMGPYGPW